MNRSRFSNSELPPGAHELITLALQEDLGGGDLTSMFFVESGRLASASIVARQELVVSGLDVAAEVFRRVETGVVITSDIKNSDLLEPGAVLLRVKGRARGILTAERTALNFLQRLCGVATLTRQYVKEVAGTGVRLLDTRKTSPGFRALEKRAVRDGGGENHRMGLYDRVMIKDNHLAAAGGLSGLQAAIDRLHSVHPGLPVEIEADTLDQVRQFVQLEGVDFLLLDNMNPAKLREAVAICQGRIKLEASGGIHLGNLRAVAETGVDYISVGAITHSAISVDLGLDFAEGAI